MRTSLSLFLFATMLACRASLPDPTYPLVASPTDGLPEQAPPIGDLALPEFAEPQVFAIEGGPTLWVVPNPNTAEVSIEVVTRRGEDGAHSIPLVRVTAAEMQYALGDLLPSTTPGSGASIRDAHLTVNVGEGDVDEALNALGQVLANGRLPSDDDLERHSFNRIQALEGAEYSSISSAWYATLDQRRGGDYAVGRAHLPLKERYESFGRDEIVACRDERWAPTDTLVTVIGNVSPTDVAETFRAVFGSWTTSRPRLEAPPRPNRPPRAAAMSRGTTSERVHVLYTHHAPDIADPAREPFELLVELLGGVFSSQLNALREQHAYTYGAHAYISANELRDLLVIRADFEPRNVRDSLTTLFAEMTAFRSEPRTRDQISLGRHRIWANLVYISDGLSYRSILRRSWTSQLTLAEIHQRYASLADLTPEALKEVAAQHLAPRSGLLVLTGDFDRIDGFTVRRDREGFHLVR